jgi:hypothetical protein
VTRSTEQHRTERIALRHRRPHASHRADAYRAARKYCIAGTQHAARSIAHAHARQHARGIVRIGIAASADDVNALTARPRSRLRDRVNAPQDRVVNAHRKNAIAINDRATAHAKTASRIMSIAASRIALIAHRASRTRYLTATLTRIKRTHASRTCAARSTHRASRIARQRSMAGRQCNEHRKYAASRIVHRTEKTARPQHRIEYRWHRDVIAHAHRARASRDRDCSIAVTQHRTHRDRVIARTQTADVHREHAARAREHAHASQHRGIASIAARVIADAHRAS